MANIDHPFCSGFIVEVNNCARADIIACQEKGGSLEILSGPDNLFLSIEGAHRADRQATFFWEINNRNFLALCNRIQNYVIMVAF